MSLKDLRSLGEKAEKDYKGMLVDADSNTLIHKIVFDSPQLTYEMNGFSVDRIHQFWGPESAGKSSLCTYIAAQLQKKMPDYINKWGDELTSAGKDGKEFKKKLADKSFVLYLDFERTFDPSHAEQIGLKMDPDHFQLLHPMTIEDGAKVAIDYIKSGSVCCVILDSDAMATTALDLESDPGDTGFGGAKGANVLKQVYKNFNIYCSEYLTPLLVISQERANMQPNSHLPSVTGGQAIKFASSTRQRITKSEILQDAVTGEDCGILMRVRNYKNKTGIPGRDANLNFYWHGGFDPDAEYMALFVALDILHKEVGPSGRGTGYYSNEELGFRVRGIDNIAAELEKQPDLYNKLKQMVDDKLQGRNELDANLVRVVDENADGVENETSVPVQLDITKLAEEALEEASPKIGIA